MADLQNPSFEIAGVGLGQAASWTEVYSSSGEDIAEFSLGSRTAPMESFEALWSSNQLAQTSFGIGDVVSALFEAGTHEHESFETSWLEPSGVAPIYNHMSQFVYASGNFAIAGFNVGVDPEESFERLWSNNGQSQYDFNPGHGAIVAGSFDHAGGATGYESYESFWSSNELSAYFFGGGGGTVVWAMFDAGVNGYEDFEGTWTETLP